MGRGPAQPITFSTNHGPARPGPSSFQTSPPGSAWPITWQRGLWNTGFIWAGPTITWAGPWIWRPGQCVVPLQNEHVHTTQTWNSQFNVYCWFFVAFSRRDSVGQLISAHETHSQYPLLIQSCSTNDSVDGFLWATAYSCCCHTRCCRQGNNFKLPASPRRQWESSVHPQRYEDFDPTFTQDKISCYSVSPSTENKYLNSNFSTK